MPAVSVLMKPSSSMCNMSCDYCFYCDEAEKRSQKSFGFMSEQTLKNVIRRTILRAEGMISYAFQGGEPSLRRLDFFEKAVAFQKQYNKNHVQVHNAFQTNGFAIDEEWCRFFKEHHFLVGLSVDGTKEIHDSMRHTRTGGGTFDLVEHAARLMDDHDVEYNILTVVTPQIVQNISGVYRAYKKRGWNFQQYIACLDPLGGGHGTTPYSLTPELYGRFLIDLFELWSRDLQTGSQPYIRQFENYVGLAAGYMAEACDQRGVCGIQNVVEADGSVYPCDFYMLDEYRLGNFDEDRLDQIDARRKELGFIERSRQLGQDCKGCPHFRLCRGGCQRSRDWNASGGFYENYFCSGYRMFFERCGEKIYEIAKKMK